MNADRNQDYFVGIDPGTGSLGVAVTDVGYHLLKIKGKDFWFVRKFDTANTQLSRRTQKNSRRRLERHKTRIGLIRSYFSEDITKHDPLFFVRQDNSKYYFEDKDSRLKAKDILFADSEYSDKEYYEEYPTVFHLRQALLKDEISCEKRYSRLLYLAIINMFEHRGHFLLNVDTDDINLAMVKDAGEIVMNYIYDLLDGCSENHTYIDLIEVLADRTISRTDKRDKLISLLEIKKSNKALVECVKCLCGLESDARVMFKIEGDEKIKIAFQQASFEEEKKEIESLVGEEYYTILDSMKKLFDYSLLHSILKGFDYLTDARVEMYKKHKEDLKRLKNVYKKYLDQEKYDVMFRSDKDGTYSAYSKSFNSSSSLSKIKKHRRDMKCEKEDLYKTILKDLKMINDSNDETVREDSDVKIICKEIDLEQFLPKQITGENGVIPNQVHKKELRKILANAERHLPFLKDIDESGYTVSERIIMLFSCNIPYYVGPIGKGSKTGWAVIKEEGPVLPWNLEQKIDIEKTSEEFIRRLVRECTYLSGEKVLPKQSLLYENYCVLNEINALKINGKRIVPELKREIYKDLFIGSRLGKKVTKKMLCKYLINRGLIIEEEEVSGIDKEMNAYLSSYGKMYAIFGEQLKEESIREAAEEIIYFGTIYGDSKEMFKKKLKKFISQEILNETQAKRILGYKFKDWAKLSKNMLCLNGCDKNTGEMTSIIRAMWDYNMNFMELIYSDDFTFRYELEAKKNYLVKPLNEFQFEDLDEYYYSASVKRMVWQTVLVLKEITKIMGHNPKRVFIEMTRSDEEKGDEGRKVSRGKKLLNLYKDVKDDRNWEFEIKNACESGRLNSKKLYLYYLQMGKDVYTGEKIEIEELFDDNRYDIDHIYPRSLTNDNSIENNLVLVSKKINQDVKKNVYPLPSSVRNNPKVQQLWYTLHKMKFMTDEKYNRLNSNEHLTDEQLSGFIARQLVETSQGSKGMADLLKAMMPEPETKIVYAKANNVSEFRREYGFLKSRLINENHHAKDAYLNIVVGNVYFTKFTQNPRNYIKTESQKNGTSKDYNLYRMFLNDVVRDGNVAWISAKKHELGTLKTVIEVMSKNTPIITRQVYEQKGELFNVQPKGKHKAKAENYVPLKKTDVKLADVKKYGGFTSLKPSYFIFIEHGPEEKRIKCFEVVQTYYASKINNEVDLKVFLENKGYKNPRVILGKIRKNSLIKLNGYFLYIVGMDSTKRVEFSNATPMYLDQKFEKYINKLEKMYKEILVAEKKKKNPKRMDGLSKEANLLLFRELINKHANSVFKNHPRNIGECLVKGENAFINLGFEDQVKILYNLIMYTSFEKGTFSLEAIGGLKELGRIRISNNMTEVNELKLINYSVTGMYKREIDLLTK